MLEELPLPPRAERAWRTIKLLCLVTPSLARETYAVILRERVDALRVVTERELRGWLQAIERHLERQPSATSFTPTPPSPLEGEGEGGGR
jgi:hypothetical protein